VCRLFEEMASWREAALRSWNQPQLAALYNEKAELILLEIKELQK
jgi:hypothetical protein